MSYDDKPRKLLEDLVRRLLDGTLPKTTEEAFPSITMWFPSPPEKIPAGDPCYFVCATNRTDLLHNVVLLNPTTSAVLCGPVPVGWLFGSVGIANFFNTNGLKGTGLSTVIAQIHDEPAKSHPFQVIVPVRGT